MATFDITPLLRSTSVGLERAWDTPRTVLGFDHAGAPAYNVLRTDENNYRISIAVPGYAATDISIETRENVLWVKGDRGNDVHHNQYVYRGLTTDAFQRTFQLPEHVKVTGASLEAGILHIDLLRELPEALKPRRIEIAVPERRKAITGTADVSDASNATKAA